jgi:hypothetical protein
MAATRLKAFFAATAGKSAFAPRSRAIANRYKILRPTAKRVGFANLRFSLFVMKRFLSAIVIALLPGKHRIFADSNTAALINQASRPE